VSVGVVASKVALKDSGGVSTTILSPRGDPVLPPTSGTGAYQTNLAPNMFHAALSSGQPVGPATVETAYGGFVIFEQPLGSPSRIEAVAQLATPTSEVDQLLRSFRMALILGLLGLFAAALALGRPLARLALRPLRSLTAAVARISPDLLEQRVALPGPADELRGLAQAFNQLLDRIEGSMRTQRLSQAQLQRFVGDASHELRSPLTALSGYVDLLLKPPGPAALPHVGPRMRREIDRMSRLVGDLLALTRLDAEPDAPCSPEVLDLGQLAEETVESMELLAAGRQLSVHRGGLELPVRGDRDSLERMLSNLVSNAIEHTDGGGVIGVALARLEGWAELRVADNGEGMAPEHLGHIFDRFYRVDAARSRGHGNAGLGLAIVKAIAQQHGGSVEAASVLGQGSTFTIRLPLAPDPPVAH
ncbi:MAG: sensor histidine kinase, partial [Chloroflexota bacterium]